MESDVKADGKGTVVIGAGIIGVAIAYALQRRGEAVTLLDRDEPGKGASYGNMASIAVTEFMPASRPAIWRQMPGWLLDPEGPVRVRPSYMPRLIPWFARYLAAGRPKKLKELEAAGAALCHRAPNDLDLLLKETGLHGMLSAEGCLSLYTDEEEFRADHDHIEMLKSFGFRHEILGGNAIRDLEPALSAKIRKALLFPDNRSIADPYMLVTALADRFCALGGLVKKGEAIGFEDHDGAVTAIRLRDGRRIDAARTIVAAGAYSGHLSRMLGEPIPLETERGYHTQIMAPGITMRHSILWPARAFMVTPTAGGIRVGGTVEMAGLHAPPDYARAKVLVKRAKEALPALKRDGATEWMGHRPALPDTVPIIGPSAKRRGAFYATGHGHLGLTYAATTASLIADLVVGAPPSIDLTPYRVDRF
jgi:D-amino-acid dehydrogenase